MLFLSLFHRIEHAKVYEQHRGHDSMHAEMVLIFIVVLVIAQVILVEWKRRHHKSYLVLKLANYPVVRSCFCPSSVFK